MKGTQLLLAVIFVIKKTTMGSLSELANIAVCMRVVTTLNKVSASDISMAVADLPWISSGHFKKPNLIENNSIEKGRFSKTSMVTFFYYSSESSWYLLRPVIHIFILSKQVSMHCTPATPQPRTSPGRVKILWMLSTISRGNSRIEPAKVRSIMLKNFM